MRFRCVECGNGGDGSTDKVPNCHQCYTTKKMVLETPKLKDRLLFKFLAIKR